MAFRLYADSTTNAGAFHYSKWLSNLQYIYFKPQWIWWNMVDVKILSLLMNIWDCFRTFDLNFDCRLHTIYLFFLLFMQHCLASVRLWYSELLGRPGDAPPVSLHPRRKAPVHIISDAGVTATAKPSDEHVQHIVRGIPRLKRRVPNCIFLFFYFSSSHNLNMGSVVLNHALPFCTHCSDERA